MDGNLRDVKHTQTYISVNSPIYPKLFDYILEAYAELTWCWVKVKMNKICGWSSNILVILLNTPRHESSYFKG
jgi:hypothetical protein